jgi:hypothetical protein
VTVTWPPIATMASVLVRFNAGTHCTNIFLDSCRCHMMASVVREIQKLGVEVEHIPGGCTTLCQPVDVGVNNPSRIGLERNRNVG